MRQSTVAQPEFFEDELPASLPAPCPAPGRPRPLSRAEEQARSKPAVPPIDSNAPDFLDRVLRSSAFNTTMAGAALLKLRNEVETKESLLKAEAEIVESVKNNRDPARKILNETRLSALVSRETQIAHLKGLLLDFEEGNFRPGLDAKLIPKLIETINKMMGYEAPIQHEIKSENKILVFPVTQESFKGELPPLDLNTLKSVEVTVETPPKANNSSNSSSDPSPSLTSPPPIPPVVQIQPQPQPPTQVSQDSLNFA